MGTLEDLSSRLEALRLAVDEICQHLEGLEVKHMLFDSKTGVSETLIGLAAIRAELEWRWWH